MALWIFLACMSVLLGPVVAQGAHASADSTLPASLTNLTAAFLSRASVADRHLVFANRQSAPEAWAWEQMALGVWIHYRMRTISGGSTIHIQPLNVLPGWQRA